MKKHRIFVTQKLMASGLEKLKQENFHLEVWDGDGPIPREKLIQEALQSDALITMLSDKIDSEFLKQCHHLKIITNYAVGLNNIDIDTATKLKIPIGHTPNVLTDATADLAMALLLNLSRKIISANKNVLNGQWKNWEPLGFLGKSLKGKTLGIFGLGRIGEAMAKRCVHGLGMKLIHTSRSQKGLGDAVDFQTLLQQSDVLSIHSPLTPETRHLFDRQALETMKKESILINTARGEIIVEEDLIEVLKREHFFGVGLDVTYNEPLHQKSELLNFDRVLITPHIGSADQETRKAMGEICAENILMALEKKKLPGFANPEVWN